MAVGEATGIAAAMAAKEGISVDKVDTARLQKRLRDVNAIVSRSDMEII
jgi:hypothetical protein